MRSFHPFPEHFPDTVAHYGIRHGCAPKAAAYRGKHRLPHQSQMMRRDLFAESRERYLRDGLRCYYQDEEMKNLRNSPYSWLVMTPGGTPITAFRTTEQRDAWLDAYALRLEGQNIVDTGADLLPLSCLSLTIPE